MAFFVVPSVAAMDGVGDPSDQSFARRAFRSGFHAIGAVLSRVAGDEGYEPAPHGARKERLDLRVGCFEPRLAAT
jgi:hypothetical protein